MSWSVPGYTEMSELGRGASGRVVLAAHDATGVKVAIKYLADQLRTEPEFIRDFRAEARIMAEVDNPQIAKLYEYVETPDGAAIVMELVEGVALRAILREQGPTEPEAALVVLKGSLLGLAAAHASGIVHRDYKPENVLVDGEGHSKLADFGIATRTGRQGPLAGTPSYMAPEQWAGSAATPATDIYAATATFFECLAGRPPFRAPGNLPELRRQHEHEPIPVEMVPEEVRGLLKRGLAKQSGHRPKDAATFLRELEAVAGAGYGADWEEDGRRKLARRAMLLALLFPLVSLQAGGTAVAQTFLGVSSKVRNWFLGGAVSVLLIGGGTWVAWPDPAGHVTPLPTASASTSPSPSPSPSPSIEPSPSEEPSPSPSLSPSLSPSASPSPPPPPPPSPSPSASPSAPPLEVTELTIDSKQFCWLYGEACSKSYRPPDSRVRIRIQLTATTTDAVNLRFLFQRVDANGKIVNPDESMAFGRTLSGKTAYDQTFESMYLTNLANYHCDRVQVTVSVTNLRIAPRPTDFIYNSCLT